MNAPSLLAAAPHPLPPDAPGVLFCSLVIYLGCILVMAGAAWGAFVKADEPGWASLVPFYRAFILVRMAGKPTSWLQMPYIPFVGISMAYRIEHEICKRFRKEADFFVGMPFLPILFWPIPAMDAFRHRAFDRGPA